MSTTKHLRAALLGGTAGVLMSGAAFAADLGASMKEEPAPKEDRKITVTGGATTDYMFRGVSQNENDPSVNAAITISYRMFYIGFSAEAVSAEWTCNGCAMEADVVGGVKFSRRGFDFDFGFIYYGYPNQDNNGLPNVDMFELKASVSRAIVKDLTLTGTVYWSPDYSGEVGQTWTVEGGISAALPVWGLTLSGTVGHVMCDDTDHRFSAAFNSDNYSYWNVGLAKTFREHYTFDVRYWGTNVDKDAVVGFLTDDRLVGSFTFSY